MHSIFRLAPLTTTMSGVRVPLAHKYYIPTESGYIPFQRWYIANVRFTSFLIFRIYSDTYTYILAEMNTLAHSILNNK